MKSIAMTFPLIAALVAALAVPTTGSADAGVNDAIGTVSATIGTPSFSLSIAPLTGRLSTMDIDGKAILVDDSEVMEAVAFDAEDASGKQDASHRTSSPCIKCEEDSLRVCSTQGLWRIETIWRIFPEDRMASRRLAFEWLGEEPIRLKSVTVLDGKVKHGEGGVGRCILPGAWPPIDRTAAQFSEDETLEGSEYTPMSLADDGTHSVMSCVNELSPFADYSHPIVYVRPDGFTLARRFETAGWMRRGERQSLGDLWLSFRDGTTEEHLRHTGDWFHKVGMLPPADRPPWLPPVAIYSMHPCGSNKDNRSDVDGLNLARSYIPYLMALGIDVVWMRPIEEISPYMPRDYYTLQPGVGTIEDLQAYVAEAHLHGLRVLRDAVPHGGHIDFPRAKAHPEWLAWKEDGKPDSWWTYDYFHHGWISAFSNIVADLTAQASLDGWRIDVAPGSRFPNWNPAIPYARGSFARLQGGLAQQRAIRAAARAVTSDAATLAESFQFSSACTSDAIYGFKTHLLWFYRFTDSETAECVRNISRFLVGQRAAMPPGAILMNNAENHDTAPALAQYGRAATTAIFAFTAFIEGFPLVLQDTEDDCFEAMRRILRIRCLVPELIHGKGDYGCVSAPEGVFACLREGEEGASVVMVNFNGRSVRGPVTHPYGVIEADLPPFGYAVRRVKGPPLPSFDAPAWEPTCPKGKSANDANPISLTLRDGSPTPVRLESETLTSGVVRWRVADLGGLDPTNVQIIVRMPGASRWLACTAEGDFDGPFFVRHPNWDWAGSTRWHGKHEGAVRWRSAWHPFGFSPDRACVSLIQGDNEIRVGGIDTRCAEAVVLDRLGHEPGLAIAIRAETAEALSCEVEVLAAKEAKATSSLTGVPELTTIVSGWEWESGDLRVRIQRTGSLRGVWRRNSTGEWEKLIENAFVLTDTGIGRKNPFGGEGTRDCKQNEALDVPMAFWREEDGTVHLDFGPGDMRPWGGAKMTVPIWFKTRYTLKPGSSSFEFESAISVEREFAQGEGEIALRMDIPCPGTFNVHQSSLFTNANGNPVNPVNPVKNTSIFGAPAAASDEPRPGGGVRRLWRWLSPDTSFSPPKGTWHGVRLLIDTKSQTNNDKEQTP